MKKIISIFLFLPLVCFGQETFKWNNVDSIFGPLPASVHIYFTNSKADTAPFRAYYLIADLKDRDLEFTTDTSFGRRLKPSQFYEKNGQPLVVVNGTFFSFETNQNLNLVMREGRLLALNRQLIAGRGVDTLTYRHVLASAIGIDKKRNADVAWTYTDSISRTVYASQQPREAVKDSNMNENRNLFSKRHDPDSKIHSLRKWKMKTAIGGGPVLLQQGQIRITNNEEAKFSGKAINDKHPRTAMGYTADHKLIILMVEGRNPNASGATLTQLAQLLKDLGCIEALNLDGGGSSCLLLNGKETITPSDKAGQRPAPGVFIIKSKKLR